jgi:hypothetical protein
VSGIGLVAGIIAAFFIIGIGVGVIAMIALSALKHQRVTRGDDWSAGRRRGLGQTADGVGWQEPPGPDDHDDGDDGYGDRPTRWPGR